MLVAALFIAGIRFGQISGEFGIFAFLLWLATFPALLGALGAEIAIRDSGDHWETTAAALLFALLLNIAFAFTFADAAAT